MFKVLTLCALALALGLFCMGVHEWGQRNLHRKKEQG